MSAQVRHFRNAVTAVAHETGSESHQTEASVCTECGGAGTVRYWNEVAFFEDVRACPRCEAGSRVQTVIAEIVKRSQFQLSRG